MQDTRRLRNRKTEEEDSRGRGLCSLGHALYRRQDADREEMPERRCEVRPRSFGAAEPPHTLQRHEKKGAAGRTVSEEQSTERPELFPSQRHAQQTEDKTCCWRN